MCTVKEIREAIREDCSSEHDMESAEIDRVLQTLPFSQDSEPFSKPRPQRPAFWFHARKYEKKVTATILFTGLWLFSYPEKFGRSEVNGRIPH